MSSALRGSLALLLTSSVMTGGAWAQAPTAAQSDALSTAFFVWSDREVADFCTAHPQIGAALAGPDFGLVTHGTLRC